MQLNPFQPLGATLFGAALLLCACSSSVTDASGSAPLNPEGPVAHNAAEAFPDEPSGVPALSNSEILQACLAAADCVPNQYTQEQMLGLVQLCVHDVTFSAERAIPMSGFANNNERAEYFVKCTLDNAGNCPSVEACRTERLPDISCQEDGCRIPRDTASKVTCNGDIATLAIGAASTHRDCSRAFAQCDPSSPTGCTDRHYTSCPEGVTKADRCDGDVRLGCDGAGQVSYHDCTRMGGKCGATPSGAEGCVYPDVDPACQANPEPDPRCVSGSIQICVNGQQLTQAAPGVCK
jgi:hypothetical protein